MKTTAIILAGGTGSRIGDALPKQFIKAAGKTIIEHTIAAFECSSAIDEIAVVVHPAYISEMENIVLRNNWRKVKKILRGGSQRHESSMAAIRAYDDGNDCRMLLHDAVRPLVTQRIIADVAQALRQYNAVDTAVPVADTIIEVDGSGSLISAIPARAMLRRGQTPQGFRFSTIKEAYRRALLDENFTATDDCGVVMKYLPHEPIFVVRGEESNMKLTYKEDIFVVEKLLSLHKCL